MILKNIGEYYIIYIKYLFGSFISFKEGIGNIPGNKYIKNG